MSLFDNMVKFGLPLVPKLIVGRVARRYVAGDTIDDAITVIRALNEEGAMTTVDVLGEEIKELSVAERAVKEYLTLLERIDQEKVDGNISIKPTLLGLNLDEDYCREQITTIVKRAAELGNFVRIDMEDHSCTDSTIRVFERIHDQHDNVGVVLQAYMHRTVADINRLLPRKPNIRLCKGIYREPRSIAWKSFDTVRANFIYTIEKMLAGGAYVGIATHDPYLIWAGMAAVDRLGLTPEQYEFQMLLGVDEELRRIILDNGHRLRVYVPYGRDWYPYSIRRLRENPTIALNVTKAMFGLNTK